MTDNEERALSLFRLYESKRGTGSENLDSSPSSDDEENTNRSLGAGLDTTASSTPHMSERRSRALESEHSPGRVRPPDWKAFHQLLLDLIWIVDELVFYSILLCNSRRIEGYCSFVAATVVNHPVMQAWWKSKDVVPTAGEECVFARLVETLDTLPCATPSVS
ncbi:hypothetical protein AGDE_14573 [Angomonas deanei]|nr:hypothetical protein AGDE_14573 [Angomonas deanei]|eukprot:EPY20619.1 hypothetical protein AGDE_14573 [Angomonas deanei]